MAVGERDRAIAEQIASEVRALTARRRTWRRVTTLLDYFGVNHLTESARGRMQVALESVGLDIEPSLYEVERFGTVRISLRDRVTPGATARRAVRVWIWQPGEEPVEQEPEEVVGEDAVLDGGGLLWVDVDLAFAEVDAVHTILRQVCGEAITRPMVEDLLAADSIPKAVVYGSVRGASAFAVDTLESGGGETESKAGELVFRLVEFLVSPAWMVTCWHAPTTSHDDREIGALRTAEREVVFEQVASRWRRTTPPVAGGPPTAGDLAILVLHELVSTYAPARRTLYAWLELWELDFYRHQEHTETKTLVDLRRGIAHFRERVAPLNRTGLRENPGRAWFPAIQSVEEAIAVDELIDRSLRDLRALGDALLASTALVSTVGAAAQAERADRFQRLLAAVAAILLVPTLIATVFGANTALPGGDRWEGFLLMIALMVLTATATWFAIARVERTDSTGERPAPSPPVTETQVEHAVPDDFDAVIAVYEHVALDPASRTPDLLRLFAGNGLLTPEEIGKGLRPNDDGSPLTRGQARAVLRNLGRAQDGLIRSGVIGRRVLVKDFSRYESEGAGRYGLSEGDRAALAEHLQRR